MTDDENAIRATIGIYQEAARAGSRDLYRRAFHPDAAVCYPSREEGGLVVIAVEAFAEEVAGMFEQGVTIEETTRDLRVDVAGDVASARVDFTLRLGDEVFQGPTS